MKRHTWKRLLLTGLVLALTVLVAQVVLADDLTAPVAISPLQAGTTDDGVAYDAYDIVVREPLFNGGSVGPDATTYQWFKLFDGEEFGLGPKHNISAIKIRSDGPLGSGCGLVCVDYILMSFGQDAIRVPDITPKVAGQDVVVFEPIISGTEVIDSYFGLAFDGSDVGLTTAGEKIDGLDYWDPSEFEPNDIGFPEDCFSGVMFISTLSNYRVPAANGGSLVGSGSDILMFCAQDFGADTAGYWFRGFDEADYPLNPSNAMNGIDIQEAYYPSSNEQEPDEAAFLFFLFTVKKTFTAAGVAGGPGEVYAWPDGCSEDFLGPVADLNDTEPSLNGVAGGFDVPYILLNSDC